MARNSCDAVPVTPATRFLAAAGAAFTPHRYQYEERGGTRVSARELGVDEHAVVKTLVFQDDHAAPVLVLMHGDRQVSGRQLARLAGRRSMTPCRPEVAERHTGYQVGGTSPFGTRRPLPVYLERSVLELPVLYLNGGRRGFLVGIAPAEVVRLLAPILVDVAVER